MCKYVHMVLFATVYKHQLYNAVVGGPAGPRFWMSILLAVPFFLNRHLLHRIFYLKGQFFNFWWSGWSESSLSAHFLLVLSCRGSFVIINIDSVTGTVLNYWSSLIIMLWLLKRVFMKHYAPNICLPVRVGNLATRCQSHTRGLLVLYRSN